MAKCPNASPDVERNVLRKMMELAADTGEPDVFLGKRRWVRYEVMMRLEAAQASGSSAPWSVVAQNVSGGGVAFWSRGRLAPGTAILVRPWSATKTEPWLTATVIHCTVGIRGYLVGAAFDTPLAPETRRPARRPRVRPESSPARPSARAACPKPPVRPGRP